MRIVRNASGYLIHFHQFLNCTRQSFRDVSEARDGNGEVDALHLGEVLHDCGLQLFVAILFLKTKKKVDLVSVFSRRPKGKAFKPTFRPQQSI